MTYTEEQLKTLSQWEDNFWTALKADYSRYVGLTAIRVIHRTWEDAHKTQRHLDTGCSHCVLSLLKDVGREYFRDIGKEI